MAKMPEHNMLFYPETIYNHVFNDRIREKEFLGQLAAKASTLFVRAIPKILFCLTISFIPIGLLRAWVYDHRWVRSTCSGSSLTLGTETYLVMKPIAKHYFNNYLVN